MCSCYIHCFLISVQGEEKPLVLMGAALRIADGCYNPAVSRLHRLSGSSVGRWHCMQSCLVVLISYSPFFCLNYSIVKACLLCVQVDFADSCAAVEFNEHLQYTEQFECTLHKRCGYLEENLLKTVVGISQALF